MPLKARIFVPIFNDIRMKSIIKNELPDGSVTLYLYGEVCEEGGDGKVGSRGIVEAIEYYSAQGKSIKLRINSIGGDVYPGIAIFNAIRRCPTPITVAIDGIAASTAGFIALAADHIEIGKYARMMIHNVSGGGYGNKTELQQLIDEITALENTIAQIIAHRTGMFVEQVKEEYFSDGRDHYINAQQAIELHLADSIYDEEPVPDEADGNEIYRIFTNRLQNLLQHKSSTAMFEKLKEKNPRFANCATEEEVEAVVAALEGEAAALKEENDRLKADAVAAQEARVTAEVEAAVADGRIGDDQRELYTNLLRADFTNGSKALSLLKPKRKVQDVLQNGQPKNKKGPWEERMEEINRRHKL